MSDDLRDLAIRALIVCVALTWLVVLWRAHRDPALKNFSIPALIMTRDGFIDRVALMELGTWFAMTLTLIALTAHDRLTEWFAFIYAALPSIRAGQVSMLRSNIPPQQAGSAAAVESTARSERRGEMGDA